MEPPHVIVRGDLPVTPLEASLVDSWPLLPADNRREPLICAVSDRRTTPARVRSVLDLRPHLTHRAALSSLLHLLEIGCLSPLEIWGFEHVFTGPGMPEFKRQVPIRLKARTAYLDLLAEDEMVNFELDGWSAHSSVADRERDLRRDAELLGLGFLVVRFTRYRLYHEIASVRRETLDILAARRGLPRSWSRIDGQRTRFAVDSGP